jgi:hypothetical protein
MWHLSQSSSVVSSQQLISSSEYFKRVLEDTASADGKKQKENGFVQIQLSDPEDKMTAFSIIIDILYEKVTYLPMSTLRCCARSQWLWRNTSGKLVTLRARTWFHALVNDARLPDHSSQGLMKWLWFAWLSGLENHFRQLSKVAQQDARNSIVLTGEAVRLPYGVLRKYSSLLPSAPLHIPRNLILVQE